MQGGREKILCPSCGKAFFSWIPAATEKPKVRCYLCGTESFPRGEPVQEASPAGAPPPSPKGKEPAASSS